MIPLTRNEIARLLTILTRPARPRHPAVAALVSLAQTTPAHGPGLPLPAPGRQRPMTVMIVICGLRRWRRDGHHLIRPRTATSRRNVMKT